MLLAGDTFHRFRIEGKLGEGGMGLVYQAYDPMLRRQVALKVVRPEVAQTAAATRLMREGRAAASLNHPNAIGIFDVGSFKGVPYIVMELVSGHQLSAFIGDERVGIRQRLSWLAQIARGLDAAHRQGLVHRDVKPENVMVCNSGEIKLFDFGVVKRMTPFASLSNATDPMGEKTRTGIVMGTPLYMAPEQALGDAVDGRSDQFAWATLAYELLSGGIHPTTTNNPRRLPVAFVILREQPRPLSEVAPRLPDGVAAIVMKALAKAPSSRFATMSEIYEALDAIILRMDQSSGRLTPTTPTRLARRRGRFLHVGLAAAALGLVAVVLFLSHVFDP
ncbi:serine/threonine protein kinase [Pendulispora brunnea]|uniref:Serine/threonine protein kinase n=1 Tax=Pendulispora brunnea TaxID=2905690 RepID=A0ABZ2K216_9BACT